MAQQNRQTLKSYFETGDKPTEDEFADLIDSFVNRLEDDYVENLPNASTSQRGIVQQASSSEVNSATNNNKYVTPLGVKNSIENFAPVTSVNGKTGEVVLNIDESTSRGTVNQGIAKFYSTNNSQNYIHIRLPYKINSDSKMYYVKASGYEYYGHDIIDVIWVGYCYAGNGEIRNDKTVVNNSNTITAGQYAGSDNHVYLWFKPSRTYYATFKLDFMRVGNGTFLNDGDIQIIQDPNATL